MATRLAEQDTRTTLLQAAELIFAHKGFSGVGINEVLSSVGVPKGSFYHYFPSKDAFGEAVLTRYYEQYLAEMDRILSDPARNWAQRVLAYFENWRATQSLDECQGRCLAVKLGAEVADMSEPMRLTLRTGTTAIVDRLAPALLAGAEEGSLRLGGEARAVAQSLYELWLGASVLAKVYRDLSSVDNAMATTRQLLDVRTP